MDSTDTLNMGYYKYIQGIKIYEGTTVSIKKDTLSRIEFFRHTPCVLFTSLEPSTLTAKGRFTNVKFVEKKLIERVTIPDGSNILKIGCNYGEVFNAAPPYKQPKKKEKTSNRGRKRKKKISTRKIQGSGKYFSSQIQALVYNEMAKKALKIKIFRTGVFQVPGIYDTDMLDLIKPTQDLKTWLRYTFNDDTIGIEYFISVMRNYKCRFKNPGKKLLLDEMKVALLAEKDNEVYSNDIRSALKNIFPFYSIIADYVGSNFMSIAEVHYKPERYFGLMIKFRRPVPWNTEKKTTIKILSSGKINFDGCNSELEALELYYWLCQFIEKNSGTIVYDPDEYESEDSSEASEKSIYDDDDIDADSDDEPLETPKVREGLSYHISDVKAPEERKSVKFMGEAVISLDSDDEPLETQDTGPPEESIHTVPKESVHHLPEDG